MNKGRGREHTGGVRAICAEVKDDTMRRRKRGMRSDEESGEVLFILLFVAREGRTARRGRRERTQRRERRTRRHCGISEGE